MTRISQLVLISAFSARLDYLTDAALNLPAIRRVIYPQIECAALTDEEYALLDAAALTAQRARRSILAAARRAA
ncbi:MAG: hypothetical protein ACR652_00570 [Methylocystis sp.]|uniref:hypothetical protein n=1 Tax=Methylocystis sp. TaxID=1911079 RepID=UPI003DA55B00